MGTAKFIPGPLRVIEIGGTDLPKAFCCVASRTTRVSIDDLWQMRLVELALVNVVVTGDASRRCAVKDTRLVWPVRQASIGCFTGT